jgi:hypothetical protein
LRTPTAVVVVVAAAADDDEVEEVLPAVRSIPPNSTRHWV